MELLGYKSREEILKLKAIDTYINPKARDEFLKELNEKGEVKDFRTELKKKDGSSIWVNISSRIFPKLGYIEGGMIDTTQRKLAEEALQESEERYRNIFNNAQVGMIRARIRDGQILECNDLFMELLGYESREEILKQNTFFHYADLKDREKFIKTIQETGSIRNYEMKLLKKMFV